MAMVSNTRDSYREIERYMERAQEEIHKAFHELRRCEDDGMPSDSEAGVLPRPPSGDFELLVSWAEDFPRAVQQCMLKTLDTESDSLLPYQKCKYGNGCPLLRAQRRRTIQDQAYLLCPSCSLSDGRTFCRQPSATDYLTREVGIQTQWTDVHDGQWTSQDGALMRCKNCRQECSFEYLRYPLTDNFDLLSQTKINCQSSAISTYLQNGDCDFSLVGDEDSVEDTPTSTKDGKLHNGFISEEVPSQLLENDVVFENGRCRSAENVADPKVDQRVKEQYSASLPKDLSRKSPVRDSLPDRSASSSTLSSQVSRSELYDFMKRVESSAYRPPSPERVETEVNTDDVRRSSGDLRDAVTQTTPQLSRSSSFTWVTECECSDLDDSVSEHSLLSFSCSTTTSSDIGGRDTTSTSSGSSALIDGIHDSYSSSLSLSSASSLKSDFSFDVLASEHAQDEPPKEGQDTIWDKRKDEQKVSLTEYGGDVTPDSGVETVVLTPELIKSSSVPALQRHLSSSGESVPLNVFDDDLINQTLMKYPVHFIELQTLEACMWLRAAGFPQYAQMYEENQFPIDLRTVEADHSFLDEDSLQSLFRRLDTLNRCVKMKAVDSVTRHSLPDDDTDEEELCALSNSWQFERSNHRWSRIPSTISALDNILAEKYANKKYSSSFSSDSVLGDDRQESPDSIRKSTSEYRRSSVVTEETLSISGSSSGGSPCLIADLGDNQSPKKSIRRTGSDRIKEGAKALLRRMDSLKGKKKKKNSQEESEAHDIIMVTTDISPSCSTNSSPKVSHQQSSPNSTEESSAGGDTSESSQGSTPKLKHRRKMWRLLGHDNPKSNSCSDAEQGVILFPDHWRDANFNNTKLVDHCVLSKNHKSSNRNVVYSNEHFSIKQGEWVYNQRYKKHGDSIVTPVIIFNRTCSLESEKQKFHSPYVIYSPDDICSRLTNSDPDISESTDTSINRGRRDSGVGSSLNRTTIRPSSIQARWHCFPHDPYWNTVRDPNSIGDKISVDTLSTPQLMVLRKFSLLKVTMLMEKYTPSSKTGWSWAVPKFIRRIRTPDYKDKMVFAVPLLLIAQRTGYPLPPSIQEALHYLEETSLDTVGIFRKSGVRSRIQKLRNQNESNPEKMIYDNQQAYDVADMVKQYFRELPEALLTNKLSETFISIFQHVPEEQRLAALQAAILLMPDENREVLYTLLSFLNKVYQHAAENQMTATNLAVCFAPSLFHLTTPRSASASPRRRKTVVILDQKELNENRAAYECLTKLILEYKQLFTVSGYVLSHHHMSYLEHCQPATLDELGKLANKTNSDWKLYVEGCINNLIKESREKYKGWVVSTQNDNADVAYKKVGDNYPLRLWKIVVEVEAPPVEVLNRILRERSVWDNTLLRCKVISKLEKQAEIFQYCCSSLPPQPPRDYCVLRSWQTDLPKGTCILVEVSIDYSTAPLIVDSVQGLVLASRYLIEPCGSGKSRVTYISRIDMCGHSPEWYNKAYGSISAIQMSHLRDSFSHGTEGPETKV